VLAERIVRRWRQHADLSRAQAIDIVKAEYVRYQIEREARDLDHYSYAKGISAVLAYIAANGRQSINPILADFGITNAQQLDASRYADFLEALK